MYATLHCRMTSFYGGGVFTRVPWRAVRGGLDCLTVRGFWPLLSSRTSRVGARIRARRVTRWLILTPCSPGPLDTAAEPRVTLAADSWQITNSKGCTGIRRTLGCAQTGYSYTKNLSARTGAAKTLPSTGSPDLPALGTATGTLAPWEIRSLLTARYRIFPENPVKSSVCHIDCHLPTVPYGTAPRTPNSPPARGPQNLSMGEDVGPEPSIKAWANS